MNNYFCGWYFKCQSEKQTLALIPAVHISGNRRSCSVQLISNTENWNISLTPDHAGVRKDRPFAVLEHTVFREDGLYLELHENSFSATGSLQFSTPSPIRYDIMGPFRYMPFMECRHSIFSMHHRVNGHLIINGTAHYFQDGDGYIEGDRGRSFPKHYAWTHCFFPEGSLMLSVAEIPIGPVHFTGVIGIIQLGGKEYRLATYLGAKAVKIRDGQVTVRQSTLTLTATLLENTACPLQAPQNGAMTRIIRENAACHARYHLSENGKTILEFETTAASFEYEYPCRSEIV